MRLLRKSYYRIFWNPVGEAHENTANQWLRLCAYPPRAPFWQPDSWDSYSYGRNCCGIGCGHNRSTGWSLHLRCRFYSWVWNGQLLIEPRGLVMCGGKSVVGVIKSFPNSVITHGHCTALQAPRIAPRYWFPFPAYWWYIPVILNLLFWCTECSLSLMAKYRRWKNVAKKCRLC